MLIGLTRRSRSDALAEPAPLDWLQTAFELTLRLLLGHHLHHPVGADEDDEDDRECDNDK